MRIEVETKAKIEVEVKRAVFNKIVKIIYSSCQQKTSFYDPGPATAVTIAFQ
jgi:hypothetical protein